MTDQRETGCCPAFDPATWDGKLLEWEDKRFIKDSVWTFFHIPLNFGSVISRMVAKAEKESATIPDLLCLSDHTSKWKMDIYLATDREIEGARNVILSGKFFCKVYEGPYRDTGKWCSDYAEAVKSKGLSIKKWYMWYTTCPKCAKAYGKNYVAIICEVE